MEVCGCLGLCIHSHDARRLKQSVCVKTWRSQVGNSKTMIVVCGVQLLESISRTRITRYMVLYGSAFTAVTIGDKCQVYSPEVKDMAQPRRQQQDCDSRLTVRIFCMLAFAFGVRPFEESRCSANLHRKNKILFTSTNHSILDAHLCPCCVHERSSVNGSNNHFIPSDDNEEILIHANLGS